MDINIVELLKSLTNNPNDVQTLEMVIIYHKEKLKETQEQLTPVRAKIKPLIDFVNMEEGYSGNLFTRIKKKIAYLINYKGVKEKVAEALAERDRIMLENKELYDSEKKYKELIDHWEYKHYQLICNNENN